MSRDSNATYLHMHHSHHADLLETFTHPHSSSLTPEDIYIPPHLQPVNPEDEDDVVPDQHAAFGIQRATQSKREISWRDLGLDELLVRGPAEEANVGGSGNAGAGAGAGAGASSGTRTMGQGRRDEPVVLALRRRPGVARGSGTRGFMLRRGAATQGAGSNTGNGLPR